KPDVVAALSHAAPLTSPGGGVGGLRRRFLAKRRCVASAMLRSPRAATGAVGGTGQALEVRYYRRFEATGCVRQRAPSVPGYFNGSEDFAMNFITTNLTINVPTAQPDLAAALAWLNGYIIAPGVQVSIVL